MNRLMRRPMNHTRMRVAFLTLAMVVAPLSAAAQSFTPGFNIFSPQDDYEIGRQSAMVANRRLPTYTDARITRIGRQLASVAPGARYPYQFRIVNDSSINAFALPGGFIYVNRGALSAARYEDEIAAVLAHEIAHVALRHGTNQASKAYIAQAGLGLLSSIFGGRASNAIGQVIGSIGGFGLNTLFLQHSRSAEEEADSLGAQIMRRAGYNPYGMVQFLYTIHRHSRGNAIEFLSSHPNPESRIIRLERELGYAPRQRW